MITMTEDKVLYSIKEAAQILGVGVDTIRRMIKDDELDGVMVRGRWKVRRASLEKYTGK